ncbi:hypothetical protein HDU92_008146, partial [Lobulomyces angularis]
MSKKTKNIIRLIYSQYNPGSNSSSKVVFMDELIFYQTMFIFFHIFFFHFYEKDGPIDNSFKQARTEAVHISKGKEIEAPANGFEYETPNIKSVI